MNKEDLIKKNTLLEKKIDDLEGNDESRRELISGFLGSYKKSTNYYDSDGIKVLSWGEIYFELGRKLESDLNVVINEIKREITEIKNEVYRPSQVNPTNLSPERE